MDRRAREAALTRPETAMPHTVFDAFAVRAAQQPAAAFLCVEAGTAQAYGVAPGTLSYGDALAQVERLRDAREKAGLTQERAAKLIKVSMRTLQRWERGMWPSQ